jgi:hypothetical protein
VGDCWVALARLTALAPAYSSDDPYRDQGIGLRTHLTIPSLVSSPLLFLKAVGHSLSALAPAYEGECTQTANRPSPLTALLCRAKALSSSLYTSDSLSAIALKSLSPGGNLRTVYAGPKAREPQRFQRSRKSEPTGPHPPESLLRRAFVNPESFAHFVQAKLLLLINAVESKHS